MSTGWWMVAMFVVGWIGIGLPMQKSIGHLNERVAKLEGELLLAMKIARRREEAQSELDPLLRTPKEHDEDHA